jgi:hypothetical protein
MNRQNIFIRIAAIASSLLLATGLVFYRAGAFNGLMESSPALRGAIVPGSADEEDDSLNNRTPPDTPSAERFRAATSDTVRGHNAFFPGSKSSPDMIRYRLYDTGKGSVSDSAETAQPDTPRRMERFMGGSKSLAPIIEPRVNEGPDTAPRRERFMGGSKSLAPIIEPSSSDTQKTTPSKNNP